MTKLLLITGLSGAGKSTALKAMEDLGYETVDNMPLSLLPLLIVSEKVQDEMVVVGVDIRSRDFSADYLGRAIEAIRKAGSHKVETLFLNCDDEVIQRRYTETRRKHPLAIDRPISDGIAMERMLIGDIQNWADLVIDTTQVKPTELRATIQSRYSKLEEHLSIFVQSFSFRQGVPRDADLVFDVRFLRNPHYDENLRPLTGLNKEIGEYIKKDEAYAGFFENLTKLLLPLLPRYQQEGKSYLTIAIGCTGGKHRSVFVAEQLAAFLNSKEYHVQHRHRDIPAK
jgi:UPF0042 nucleotide-binding protein